MNFEISNLSSSSFSELGVATLIGVGVGANPSHQSWHGEYHHLEHERYGRRCDRFPRTRNGVRLAAIFGDVGVDEDFSVSRVSIGESLEAINKVWVLFHWKTHLRMCGIGSQLSLLLPKTNLLCVFCSPIFFYPIGFFFHPLPPALLFQPSTHLSSI